MGVASAISGGLGLAGSIYQTIQGNKEQREAERALRDYKRQDLSNVTNGLQVSTLGSDLQREEQARLASSQVDAARNAGVRGIVGSVGRIAANNNLVNARTAADLDAQQKQLDQMRAQDDANIRNIREAREQGDINALSSQYRSGKQDMYGGIGNIIQSTGMLAGSFGKNGFQNEQQFTTSGSPITIEGTNYSPANNQYDFNYGFNSIGQPDWKNPFVYNNPYLITKR